VIVTASHVTFTHEQAEKPILKDISFSLEEGSLTSVIGRNGEGKTTLLTLLAGVFAPDSGELSVAGFQLPGEAKQLRGHAALAPQDPDLYIVGATVREDLLLAIPAGDAEGRRKALDYAGSFGLTAKLDMPVHFLSFGEKRKLCLASALAGISGKPLKLLLLDEPFSGLDYPSALAMRALLKANKAAGLSQVVVTHDLDYVVDFTDRCLMLKDGGLLFDGPPDAAGPRYREAGVRPPLPFHPEDAG
jgi:biotin transport system ATP-binding protein